MGARKKRFGITGIGAILALLLGSGLFAVVSDSVFSNGNSLESGTYTPPHDLKAARADKVGGCAGVQLTDGPFTAWLDTDVNLASSASLFTEDSFCLKNQGLGNVTGKLTVKFVNVTQTEIGACEASESGGGGDTSCNDGDAGELMPNMYTQWYSRTGESGGYAFGPHGYFASLATTPVILDSSFTPGESVQVQFSTYYLTHSASQVDKLKAQTDRIQWDIQFTLEDV